MRCATLALGPAIVASFAHLAACTSDEAPPPPPAPAGDVDAGPTDPVAEGESLTILVVGVLPSGAKALPGAKVVFDKPGGERVETQAGPDGLVTLTGIDWSKGNAAVSAFAPGSVLTSVVELTKEGIAQLEAEMAVLFATGDAPRHDLTIPVSPDEPKNPTLSGTVLNATGNHVILSTSIGGGPQWQGSPGPYAFTVQPGLPFSIVSAELSPPGRRPSGHAGGRPRSTGGRRSTIRRSTRTRRSTSTSPLVPTKVQGKMILPGGDAGALGGSSKAFIFVRTIESGGTHLVGPYRKIDVSADGSAFDFELEYVPIEGATLMTEAVIQAPSGGASIAFAVGAPAQGTMLDGFLPPPEVKTPSRSLSEPIPLLGIPDGARARIAFFTGKGEGRWVVECPHGVTSVTLPAIDGALKEALGKPEFGNIAAASGVDPNGGYQRYSVSPQFMVK